VLLLLLLLLLLLSDLLFFVGVLGFVEPLLLLFQMVSDCWNVETEWKWDL
jgi:hypothetical protein